jgi:hypothetical protein
MSLQLWFRVNFSIHINIGSASYLLVHILLVIKHEDYPFSFQNHNSIAITFRGKHEASLKI